MALEPTVQLSCGGQALAEQVSETSMTTHSIEVDVSGLQNDEPYEVTVELSGVTGYSISAKKLILEAE